VLLHAGAHVDHQRSHGTAVHGSEM
jgi:hypothetical protein